MYRNIFDNNVILRLYNFIDFYITLYFIFYFDDEKRRRRMRWKMKNKCCVTFSFLFYFIIFFFGEYTYIEVVGKEG